MKATKDDKSEWFFEKFRGIAFFIFLIFQFWGSDGGGFKFRATLFIFVAIFVVLLFVIPPLVPHFLEKATGLVRKVLL